MAPGSARAQQHVWVARQAHATPVRVALAPQMPIGLTLHSCHFVLQQRRPGFAAVGGALLVGVPLPPPSTQLHCTLALRTANSACSNA